MNSEITSCSRNKGKGMWCGFKQPFLWGERCVTSRRRLRRRLLLRVSGASSIDCNISATFSRISSVTPTEVRFLCVAVFLAFFVSSFPGSYVLPPPLCFHDFFFAHDDFSKKDISLQRQSSEASRLPANILGF